MKHIGILKPPGSGLRTFGPLIDVTLRPARVLREAMEYDGDKPKAVHHKLLIDTGAYGTIVARQVAESMRLQPIRWDPIVGVSQKQEDWPVYRMGIEIVFTLDAGEEVLIETDLEVAGSPPFPKAEKHVGLLGRDFLADWVFTYAGPRGGFLLEGNEATGERLSAWRKTHPKPKRSSTRKPG